MWNRLSCSFAVLLLTIAAPCSARQPKHDFSAFERSVKEQLRESKTPGAVAAIVSGDRVIYAKAFGVANIETGAPVTTDMLFRTGSTGKMLTAAVLVALAEQAGINLDAPIGDYVTGLGPRLSQVTTHQLLSHSAGIIDYARSCCAQDESALTAQVRAIADANYFFTQPGKVFSYSNPSYILAGHLIQEITGQPYAQVMDQQLFQPLGMTRTTYRPTVAMTFPLSQGHVSNGARPAVVRPFANNTGDWPAGFTYTTVSDLARFTIAFMNDGRLDGKQVLSSKLIETLSRPYVDVPYSLDLPTYENVKYGHGFFIEPYRGVQVLHHAGIIHGFGSFLAMVPEHRFAVIILANQTAAIFDRSADKAMELMLPLSQKAPAPASVAIPMAQDEMQSYAGTYVNGALEITLSVKDGQLVRRDFYPASSAEGPGRDVAAPVTKIGEGRFLFAPTGNGSTAFLLQRGPDGSITYLHSELNAAARVAD